MSQTLNSKNKVISYFLSDKEINLDPFISAIFLLVGFHSEQDTQKKQNGKKT